MTSSYNEKIFLTKVLWKIKTPNVQFLMKIVSFLIWKIKVEPERPQFTGVVYCACWVRTRNTHSEYVILISFPLQQWLCEHAQCYIVCRLPVSVSRQCISTHHRRLNVVSTDSSELENYMYRILLGSTNFPKILNQTKKPRCQGSDIKPVLYPKI
jgi:hypothetical protein